ncbi:MAG: polysaccharide deacetylase family protein [Nitrospinae bacterium]|nr:polysaccharide deacetylase family protein [Nitrospinota bacterium]MBF0634415.1 polysaccharide deacetylase family protein [Nitrospinota bacterium]
MDQYVDLISITPVNRERGRWITETFARTPRELWDEVAPSIANTDALASLDHDARRKLVAALRTARMYITSPPMSSRLPFSYQAIPGPIRRIVAKGIGRLRRSQSAKWARFPAFPIDLTTDALSDLILGDEPLNDPTPVIVTHDIDTSEGEQNLPLFLEIEESLGARSTNFVVPFKWNLDHGLLERTINAGHEIGVHGYDHGNQTPYMQPEMMARRFDQTKPFIERYRCRGYRAPTLLRTRELLAELALRFDYDSSVPTSGGLFPAPNNGCATARPFRAEGIWEIPLSMPRDAGLMFLGYGPEEIECHMLDSARLIRASGGVVVLLTHCEKVYSGNRIMLDTYRRILSSLAGDGGYRFMTMSEYHNTYLRGRQ